MLVKNTIIALILAAPAFAAPVTSTTKSTSTSTSATAKPATVKVSNKAALTKAAVSKAVGKVAADRAEDLKLRKELRAVDGQLGRDSSKVRKLEKGDKATTKLSKSTTAKNTAKFSALKVPKNKLNLRVGTTSHRVGHTLTTPGSGRSSLGSALSTGRSRFGSSLRSAPGTGRSPFSPSLRTAVGTGRSPYSPSFRNEASPYGFGGYGGYSPGFQSPGFGGNMNEQISFKPVTGGGYQEDISWQPQSQQLNRRALTPTSPSAPLTPTTPSAALTPLEPSVPKHKNRKSAALHQHTFSDAIQLATLLSQAEKVVNGLQAQLNQPPTVFHNLKRKSKFRRPTTPITPITPATPATPSTPAPVHAA